MTANIAQVCVVSSHDVTVLIKWLRWWIGAASVHVSVDRAGLTESLSFFPAL